MQQLVNAKSEKDEALNIIIESATQNDRSYPAIGNGTVADLKVSLFLMGYNTDDSSSVSSVDNNVLWSSLGSGPTGRDKLDKSSVSISQGESAILFSTAGFVRNNDAFWNAVKADLDLTSYSNATLISLFSKAKSKIHRVYFVSDLDKIEPYVALLLPLFTSL